MERRGLVRFAVALLAMCACAVAGEKASLPPPSKIVEIAPKGDVKKARFEFWIPKHPVGVLVLIDGQNMAATALTGDRRWRDFAAEHGLALCGAEFVSDDAVLNLEKGYFDVPADAGDMLLAALDESGLKGKPLLMFGISAGARFINSFLAWKPGLITTWAAYTVNAWCPPQAGRPIPPGLVACGQYDDSRYGACLAFVQQARALRQPVAWVSLHQVRHQRYIPLETFTREFFDAVLRPQAGDRPVVVDYVKENEVTPKERWQYLLSCELPSERLLADWRAINEP